ncbi:ABC transporter permease [Gordonia alkaliphila]|uniref:ABC transporter permease n=1 Tax=Gordonia alkaliphila TaxID=1053547 RepID=UPI001FF56727|nr:ABC transporter permease [Gordonia alkaliphila]MCK0438703.1 ABC transporter permease [Gordonia alkaliphila]
MIAAVRRGVAAEAVRTGGLRSVLLLGAVPAGVLLPLLITAVIAYVAERIAGLDSSRISVSAATTSNSVYWIITFTVVVGALVAAYAQATSMRGAAGDVDRYLYRRSWTSPLARWLFYGLVTAAACAVLVAAVMAVLPAVFPLVYSDVDLFSATGLRFLITVPIYAFFACGLGVGLAGLIGHPAGALAALLAWVFVMEEAVIFAPNGTRIQAFMPFLNGVWGTGQDLVISPPWGVNGALAWFAGICAAVFGLGLAAVAARRRPGRAAAEQPA